MGFRPEPTQYKLKFNDDTMLAGLEVVMGSVSVAEYSKLTDIFVGTDFQVEDKRAEAVKHIENKETEKAQAIVHQLFDESVEKNDWLIKLFTDRLISWNLEDEKGKPVPTTEKGVRSQERVWISRIINQWYKALAVISPPLSEPSTNGSQSEEGSTLGLDDQSESLQS